MKVKDVIRNFTIELNKNNIEDANLKVKLLLSYLLNIPKEFLIIHSEDELDSSIEQKFNIEIQKVLDGFPVQYIIHKQYFEGLEFYVDENVLIPQPDTEILVEETINIIKENYKDKKVRILDLCTGSGAIAISIASILKKDMKINFEITASDISEKAIEIAKRNAINNDVEVNFVKSNLFESINEKFDIIVSNPPYIETNVINGLSKEVQNEPIIALDGGQDGLDFYRKIVEEAK